MNQQSSIGKVPVVNRSTVTMAFMKLVLNAFPFVTRYLTADTVDTIAHYVLVIRQ